MIFIGLAAGSLAIIIGSVVVHGIVYREETKSKIHFYGGRYER